MVYSLPERGRDHRRRRGCGSFKLLFVVAVVATLVGLLIPLYEPPGCGGGSPRTRAVQDLEVLKKAISIWDAREPRILSGTDLRPLLGRYMQEPTVMRKPMVSSGRRAASRPISWIGVSAQSCVQPEKAILNFRGRLWLSGLRRRWSATVLA